MIGREDTGRPAMRAIAVTKSKILLVLAIIAAGLMYGGSTASAATTTINLCALPGNATLTGAVSVPIWGFATTTTAGDCSTATASLPGPQLEVTLSATEPTTVTFNVTNALPAGHSITFEIPGITFGAGPADIAPGGTLTRSFTAPVSPPVSPPAPGAANGPGTYLYGSGGDGGRQQAMGLYGALIVRPSTAGQAYESAGTAYDVEAPLVLSAVDPAFNDDPMAFDMHSYRATYWLINGKAYPDTPGITAAAGSRVLLRYLNAGYDNTTMMLLGMHEHVVAKDAWPLNNPYDAIADTIPAGATEDAIATVPAGGGPNGFPLFNRQLHLTNGDQTGQSPTPSAGGGMLTFIHYP
jgi:FtsP/CotA-like multicopper oxidase with cupredoxin domain